MTDRTVSVKVQLLAQNYFAGLSKMQAEQKKTADSATTAFNRQKAAFNELGTAATAVSLVFTGAFVAMVKASADFEQRMSQVQALSRATAGQMDKLRAAAFTAGTAFGLSATQVADAQIELTKAGVSVRDIIGGALPGALALAAAGQIDVAKATEIASNAMTEFKLRGSDVPHVADLLAASADKSVASVDSVGDALNQSGLVAAQFGLSIEDTVGTLTAFSKAGLNGSDAGTSFKTMLTQLASPSKQAAAELQKYNIQVYDAQGNFVGITNLADQLQKNLGKVSQAQRNAALSTIFGNDAIRASSVLYDLGGKKLQGFIDGNNEAGFAALQASKKLDNLNGDVQKLGAAFQNDLIKSGSAGNDVLRGLAQSATGVLDVFGSLPKPIQGTALGLAAVGAGVTGLTAGFLLIYPRILAAKAAMEDLNITGKGLAKTVGKGGLVAVGIAALGGALSNLGAEGEANATQLEQASLRVKGSYKDIDKAFGSAGSNGLENLVTGASGAKAALDQLTGGPLQQFGKVSANLLDGATAALTFGAAATHLGDVFKSNEGTFKATGSALSGLATQDYSAATSSFNRLVTQLGGGRDTVQKLLTAMPAYNDTVVDLAKQAGVAATETNKLSIATGRGLAADALRIAQAGAKSTAQTLNTLAGSAVSASTDISDLAKTIEGFGSASLDARSAQRAFEQAVSDASDAARKNGKTLDISTQAGRDNQAALDGIASAASNAASKILEQTGSQQDAAAAIAKGRKAFIDAAQQMGLTRSAAGKLADQLGLIPSNVTTAVHVSGLDGALGGIANVKGALNALNGRSATVAVHYTETGKQLATGGVQYGFASGGGVSGPGPKGKDSVLAYLAPGEHVLTAKEVDRMGGQAAVYAFRAGLRAYAAGGAIGDSTAAAAEADREAKRYAAQLKAAKQAANRAEKAYDAIDGTKKNAAAKKAAKARQDTADKRVDDLSKKLDDARQARSDANDAAAQLRNDREDFVSGQRRATADDPIDPLSYVDQLRSMSRNDDFSAVRRKSFDAAANRYETSLVKQQTALEKATTSLNDFKSAADSMKSSITSAIAGGYTLTGVPLTGARDASTKTVASGWITRNGIRMQNYNTVDVAASAGTLTASGIDQYYRQGAASTASFAADLKTLAARGVAPALLAELAGYGVEQGAPIAKALLSGTSAQLASISRDYGAIQTNASKAAGIVTDANYAALIADAQKNADKIAAQIASDGEKLRKLIAQAFGLTGYAVGTMSATPGWHLVGEQGPELVRMRGREEVSTAAQTRQLLAAGQGRGTTQVVMPQSMTLVDADGALIGRVRVEARGVASQVVTERHDDLAIRLLGAAV